MDKQQFNHWEETPKYQQWVESLKKNHSLLEQMELLGKIDRPNGDLLFGFFKTQILDSLGQLKNQAILIRGHAVIIIPVITVFETGKQKLALIRQFRIVDGAQHLELPAGMMDHHQTEPLKVAVHEIEEELHMKVKEEDLTLINNKPYFVSPGLMDEGIYVCFFHKTMTQDDMKEYEGLKTGNMHEQEDIQVTFKTMEEAFNEIKSAPNLLALYLMNDYTQKNKPL